MASPERATNRPTRSAARPTLAERSFCELLDRSLEDARLRLCVGERERVVGRGTGAPAVSLRVHDPRFFARVIGYGNLGMGEAYMDGQFELEAGSLAELLTILLRNQLDRRMRRDPKLALRLLLLRVASRLRGKPGNVQAHYDIGDDLFESFLDPTLTYSCGYARSPDDDLETLQQQKLDRICRKLRLEPGLRLLDIGCGYGGLLAHAVREYGVTGLGVTISRHHAQHGNALLSKQGLADRARIEYRDYAEVRGPFDRVVSVGMLEHVPRREYRRYFDTIARVLGARGLGLVHAIGCNTFKNEHDPFIQRYVFPGSGQPRLSEIAANLERNRLATLDVENIVRHYDHTVSRWLERFQANRARLDPGRYDERFCRMWEYYFGCGIAAARASDGAVYQVLFTNDYALPLPLARV